MRGEIPPLHQYAFMAWCSVAVILEALTNVSDELAVLKVEAVGSSKS